MEIFTLAEYLTAVQGTLRAILALCALVLVILCTNRRFHIPASKYFLYFVIAMGLWGFFGSIFFVYPDIHLLPSIRPLMYTAISFGGPTFMLFCFSYAFPHKKTLMKSLRYIFILPCVFSLSVILPPLQQYSVLFTNEVRTLPYRHIVEQYNFLFFVYTLYSSGTVLLGSAMLLYKALKYPKETTTGSKVALVATLLFIGQNILVSIDEYTTTLFWIPPLIVTLSMVLFFFTLYYDTSEQIIIHGEITLLETIPFPIFILNKNDVIVHLNKRARSFFTSRENKSIHFFEKKDLLRQFTTFEIDVPLQATRYQGTNNFIQKKDDKTLFFLQEQEINDEEHRKNQGHVMMLMPLTSIQDFFTVLENKAFRDSLCKCYNRHFLELKQREPISPDSFPVSMLMCDLDNLKKINDFLGHSKGDEYILACYNELCRHIGKNDLVFRLGGDEFLVILQKTPADTAQAIARKIESKVAQHQNFAPYTAGISIGTSTAYSPDTSLEACIKHADQEMYKIKARHKEQQ